MLLGIYFLTFIIHITNKGCVGVVEYIKGVRSEAYTKALSVLMQIEIHKK